MAELKIKSKSRYSSLSDRLMDYNKRLALLHPSIHLISQKKRNVTDEKQYLNEALFILESQKQGLGDGKLFLSGTNQLHSGDLAVVGTLHSLEGLPVHTNVVENRGGPIPNWHQRIQTQLG